MTSPAGVLAIANWAAQQLAEAKAERDFWKNLEAGRKNPELRSEIIAKLAMIIVGDDPKLAEKARQLGFEYTTLRRSAQEVLQIMAKWK